MRIPGYAGFARGSLGVLGLVLGLAGPTAAEEAAVPDKWEMIKQSMFAGRNIDENAANVLELDTPSRAEDSAVVPIAIRTKLGQDPASYVKKVYLVIDNNPSPVGAIFTFTPDSGRADIETRVRIEAVSYTHL
ncbi:MAG TPA: hypothetical protein DCX80_10880, partial [Chloroflexi bacterium]|nr:hypothetical protein [Chloroflexota bacterium]